MVTISSLATLHMCVNRRYAYAYGVKSYKGDTNIIESPVLLGTKPQQDCFPLALKEESTIQAEEGVIVKPCEVPSKSSVKVTRDWACPSIKTLNSPMSK